MKQDSFDKTDLINLTVHGVLVRVANTGILITGDAGTGKSDCALELISRGHSLIADDAVVIQVNNGKLLGESPDLTRGILYIRGLGAIRIADVFGPLSLKDQSPIDFVIKLLTREEINDSSDIFPDFQPKTFLGQEIATLSIPVRSSVGLAIIVETAVKIFSLQRSAMTVTPTL